MLTHSPTLLDWYASRGLLKTVVASRVIENLFTSRKRGFAPLLLAMLKNASSFRDDATLVCLSALSMEPDQEKRNEQLLASSQFQHLQDNVIYERLPRGGAKVLQWNAKFRNEATIDTSPMVTMIARIAERYTHSETMEWLVTHCGVQSFFAPMGFAHNDDKLVATFTWLNTHHAVMMWSMTLTFIVEAGNLTLVQWFHANRPEDFTDRIMDLAARSGHLHIVKWLHENRSEGCTDEAMEAAAQHGHLEVVQWLQENRTEDRTNFAMARAALGGKLEVLIWLCQNRSDACRACVIKAFLGYENPLKGAAHDPLLLTLRWLDAHAYKSEGCTDACCEELPSRLSHNVAENALLKGDVQLLTYLHEHHAECLAWWPQEQPRVARAMVENGHVGCVKWMFTHHHNDCDWHAVREDAERKNFTSIIEWLDNAMLQQAQRAE